MLNTTLKMRGMVQKQAIINKHSRNGYINALDNTLLLDFKYNARYFTLIFH